ncbi:hypothetical protein SLINC_5451 [Streptomyces lincolnensis]|uniref:Uncharacterized protein n=1 Tax=Streptomyces lincolnensis TaxID=1915 RepID=A0A1B1MGC6_STRLN|nr:AfsR/SARP family transcriptional regulator [Streptomyces lincolnensis]ANS67675.1 hypothetical protein SLINC_5451 [Streptomyces lincolnensis]QMV09340.1 hypothetical protein GJU35_29290 [Streptomyces lincolnensis]
MEVRVLGPFAAELNGVSVVPTAGKPRQLLALLALHSGQILPVPTLVEELWGMSPPRTAVTTLHTYVMQLRRMLMATMATGSTEAARRAKDVLTTQHGGYLLAADPELVDAHGFDRLSAAGRRAVTDGDLVTAGRCFSEALAFWRGQALVDIRCGMLLEAEQVRLEEARITTLEGRIDLELALGRPEEVLSELSVLVTRMPLHEGFCAQRMVALYRTGRQTVALDAFHRLRRNLVAELGIEPSVRLQSLYRSLLEGDPEPDSWMAGSRRRQQIFAAVPQGH